MADPGHNRRHPMLAVIQHDIVNLQLHLLRQRKRRRRRAPKERTVWVRPWIERRQQFGIYHQLMVRDQGSETGQLRLMGTGDCLQEKTRGGDFFRAKIYTEGTKSSAPGRVRDFGNGTYGVTFRLLWEGDVTISVLMVHSSSAVRVLKRVAESFPFNRSSYAGVQWYCQRPRNASCDATMFHRHAGYLKEHTDLGLTEEEMRYFKFTTRQPETVVIIKSPNTSGATFDNVDEWYLFQIYLPDDAAGRDSVSSDFRGLWFDTPCMDQLSFACQYPGNG
ncbi:NXPE3 [Branchiostoma lanceolatum]|uniref:NXPE3 protein n=1 Tax=Branchiostoma lanceolatum TaxID=7740 RepID=A0A8K0AEJ4_BRALA|nr:NXPE3 [Branchiostoma lanceolatum]